MRFRIEEGQDALYWLLAPQFPVHLPSQIVSRRYNTGFRQTVNGKTDEPGRIRHNAIDAMQLESSRIFLRIGTSLRHDVRERADLYGYDMP
jgi:hypothetical protein